MWMYPPSDSDEGWQVAENERDWPTRYDAVSIEPRQRSRHRPGELRRLAVLGEADGLGHGAHMGILFGVSNQIVLALTAIGLISIVIRGYQMWWQRRPTRGTAWTAGRPPLRGTLRNLSPGAVAGLVIAVLAVGWFLPLWGASLLAFLVSDAVIAAVKRRRV